MNRKLFNIILFGTITALSCMFGYQMYKLNNYRTSIQDLKDSLLSYKDTDKADSNSSSSDSAENENQNTVAPEDINYDTGAGLEQDNPPAYYTLDIINFEIINKYIEDGNGELLEIYSYICNVLKPDLKKDTTTYIDESSINLENNILNLSLIDVDSKVVVKTFEINVPSNDKIDASTDINITVPNLAILEPYLKDSKEGTLKVLDEIKSSLSKDVKKDITCYIDAKSIKVQDNLLSFSLIDNSTKNKIKSITCKI